MEIRPLLRCRASSDGFTLLEMMVTLAIAAILLTVVAPAFGQLIAGTRITTSINDFDASIQLIRSEAITRGIRTTLCPSSDGVSCLDQPVWEHGWIAFVDTNEDKNLDTGEKILRLHAALDDQISIRSGSRKRIVFRPSGMALGGLNGTYTVCDTSDAAPPKALILSNSGRVRLSLTKSDGDPLECP